MRPTVSVSGTAGEAAPRTAQERVAPRSTSLARALSEVVRVPQWPENGLVVAAPLAAAVLLRPDVLLAALVAIGLVRLAVFTAGVVGV